jgi:hypothetical protein
LALVDGIKYQRLGTEAYYAHRNGRRTPPEVTVVANRALKTA